MIDQIYKVVQTLVNKEQSGYITPTEFNLLATNIQENIFRGYFEDENRDKNRLNRGLSNRGYSNLPFNERQRIDQFAEVADITGVSNVFTLPTDLYFIEDDGVITKTVIQPSGDTPITGRVIEEVQRSDINYLNLTGSAPTIQYPIYERYSDNIRIYPSTITEVELRYLRTPKAPQWTYFELSNGDPVFNPSNPSYQDFELHQSEFSNIVVQLLSHFGISIREGEIIQVAEQLDNKIEIKDNN